MKGVFAIAASVFKWGVGIWIGFVGVCIFIYLMFFVIGLIAIWYRKRQIANGFGALHVEPKEKVEVNAMGEIIRRKPVA